MANVVLLKSTVEHHYDVVHHHDPRVRSAPFEGRYIQRVLIASVFGQFRHKHVLEYMI
jgi:hypothetical protein